MPRNNDRVFFGILRLFVIGCQENVVIQMIIEMMIIIIEVMIMIMIDDDFEDGDDDDVDGVNDDSY